ncbi:MAG: anti-sigma factor antagonist [Bacteroidetes bacterium]|nr:MAG: anti-sigma factor antagonist [Bacteroidota bacterium]
MKYTNNIDKNILYITFEGDLLGAGDNLELMDSINDALNQGVKKAIINMSKVKYMNSSGIGVLITIYTKFKNRSGEAVVCNVAETIMKLLVMTKLDAVIKIYPTEAQALGA